jgi:Domain of unknown function (DUF4386)
MGIMPPGATVVPRKDSEMNSTKQTARLAGLAYLLNGVGSALGTVCIPLVRPDVAAIAKIAATELPFRIAFVSDLVAQASGIFLLLLLYELLKPVNRKHAAFMVVLFLPSVPISIAIALNDVAAHVLLRGDTFLSAFSRPQLDALAMVFLKMHVHGAFAAQIFWGLWLMPFGLLVFKSGFIKRCLMRWFGNSEGRLRRENSNPVPVLFFSYCCIAIYVHMHPITVLQEPSEKLTREEIIAMAVP